MSFIREIKAKNGRVYLAEVESQRVNGKVTQRHLRYIGKQADGRTILSASISEVEVEQVKRCGPLLVLHDLAMAIGLPDLLGTYSSELLSLVYAHCLEYKSVNQMSARLERTDLNMLLHLDGLTEARLLKALDALAAQDTDFCNGIFSNRSASAIPLRTRVGLSPGVRQTVKRVFTVQ